MDLMAQCGEQYKISLDPSYRRRDYPEKWWYYEIRGKDGALWPFSVRHLIVAFYHGWRSRTNAQGDVLWIPARRSRKAKRFQATAGSECEVIQNCDEATCFKVPNKYLARALKFIDPQRKRQVSEIVKARLRNASKSRALILAGEGLTKQFLNDLPSSADLATSETFGRAAGNEQI